VAVAVTMASLRRLGRTVEMARTAQMQARMRQNTAKPIKTIRRGFTDFPPALLRHMVSAFARRHIIAGLTRFGKEGART
jgi:hypothetical protein